MGALKDYFSAGADPPSPKQIFMKGFKVTDNSRKRIFGIACHSLEELIVKGCKKLQESKTGITAHLQDGTIIDEDYFKTLSPQSVIILSKGPVKTGADLIYEVLQSTNIDVLRAGDRIKEFFQTNVKEKIQVLSRLIKEDEDEEDFERWAEGVNTTCRTKESFMEMRCRERIRGYFHSAVKSLRLSDVYSLKKFQIETFVDELKKELNRNRFQGEYFNRKLKSAMCDQNGVFTCGGIWDRKRCNHNKGEGHKINPYLTREQRIIFSTWNLDHRIEKSRTIIPSLINAIKSVENLSSIDSSYIYELLFTKENLKIVHIVCHDKSAHTEAVIEEDKLFLKDTRRLIKI